MAAVAPLVSTDATAAPSDARRLLVITYHFDPNGPVGGLRWLGITKYLARLGWKAAVVTAASPIGRDTRIDAQVEWCPRLWTLLDGCRSLRQLALGRSLKSFPDASRVARASGPPGPWRQLGMELAALLAFPDESRGWMLRAALRTRRLIRRLQPQAVVSSGPPHGAHLVAWMATIGSPVRWLIDLRDPWAGPLPKVWQLHPRLGSRVFRALSPPLERFAFRAAHGVITSTRQLTETLATTYPDVPVVCIPNGVDPECLPPPARHQYPGLSIAYAGTLYGGRDLRPVVRALGIFLQCHPEAAHAGSKLRVAGEATPQHARACSDAVAEAGLHEQVEMLGALPRAEALKVVSSSRLAVVLAQNQALQTPAKLYESVAMRIPTLVVAELDSASAIEGRRVGAMVRDPGDVEGIAGVLEQVWRNDSRRRPACPVPITYAAIAPLVDSLLRGVLHPRAHA